MTKKLIVLLVIVTLFLSAFALVGCEAFNLAEYRANGREAIQAHADIKISEDDYTDEGLKAIAKAVADGMDAVDAAEIKTAVDDAVKDAKDKINAIPKKNETDFILTISVDETTVMQGENFKVNIELKNNSGIDQEITFDVDNFLFFPYIPNWDLRDDWGGITIHPWVSQQKVVNANSILQNQSAGILDGGDLGIWVFGSTLESGTHELKFVADFYLNWEQSNQQQVEVWSNTVVLTVEEEIEKADFILTISVDETTVAQGENFKVNIELKNNSGKDQEIIFDVDNFLFFPHIPNWDLSDDWDVMSLHPWASQQRFMKANSVLRNIGVYGGDEAWVFGSTLESGTHELKFVAEFYLNFGEENQERLEVWSNTIVLIVQ